MFKQFLKHLPFGISLIVLFTAVLLLVAIVPMFGNKTLIVRTGSMSPAIGVGDLIFVFPKPNYQVGDIITFNEVGKSKTTVTHRIASIKEENGQTLYQTKGDANKLPDGNLIPKGNVLGSADYSIKGVGKIFAMVKTKNGLLLTAIFPAALVIILELFNIVREFTKPKTRYARSVDPNDFWSDTPPPVNPNTVGYNRTRSGNPLKRLLRVFHKDKSRILMRPQLAAAPAIVYPNLPKFRKPARHPMGLSIPSVSLRGFFISISEKINFRSLKPNVGLPYYATSYKALLPYAIVVVLFTGTTFATTYSDSEQSKGNSFTAASVYPAQNITSAAPLNNIVSTDSVPNPSPSPSPSPESTPSASPGT